MYFLFPGLESVIIFFQAVLEGYWILLEDINCASSDVITLVSSLVKNGSMAVPGFSDNVQPHPDLQLFATERFNYEVKILFYSVFFPQNFFNRSRKYLPGVVRLADFGLFPVVS